jgi:formylglycine-generating enzyme required for sulfatase activity
MGSTKAPARAKPAMVYVPAGKFVMGSKWPRGNATPVRAVYLDAFRIGKTDVTVGQFRAYSKATGLHYDWAAHMPAWGWHDDHPMVNVTWSEARTFCKWAGGDLPTEAQWEKAARGADGRTYPWGNRWDKTKCAITVPPGGVVTTTGQLKGTMPVGSHPTGPSPYGCLDMAGNVWQLCRDRYGRYDPRATRNPVGTSSSISQRVLRGGCWDINADDRYRQVISIPRNAPDGRGRLVTEEEYCQCSTRSRIDTAERRDDVGFRLACRG